MCPQLEDHEVDVWYPHPVYDLSCNLLGIIVFGDDVRWTSTADTIWITPTETGHRINLGQREKIVMECYTKTLIPNCVFFHIDGNPYNLTQENLVYYNCSSREDGNRYYNKRLREFLATTVSYMNSRTPLLLARGVDPENYWDAMLLPKRLMRLWRKQYCGKSAKPVKNPRGYYKPNQSSAITLQWLQVYSDQGMTQKAMAQALQIKIGMVRYYLKKIKMPFDI